MNVEATLICNQRSKDMWIKVREPMFLILNTEILNTSIDSYFICIRVMPGNCTLMSMINLLHMLKILKYKTNLLFERE